LQIKTKIVSCHTAEPKPVKQEVNGTVIRPPLVFTGEIFENEKDETLIGERVLTKWRRKGRNEKDS
jgi:hypothetical protein